MRNYETKIYDYIDRKTGAHIVKATTLYAGKTISAYSKCNPEDIFNLELGTNIALKRLDLKIAHKRQASMIAYAKFCKMNLDVIDVEKRRIKKAMERAEVATLDRKLEIKTLEADLSKLLTSL
jgi:septum formation topological specificity factor MinE